MKKRILVLFFALLAAMATAGAAQWQPSYTVAVSQAKQTNKPLLLLFTGPTWCPGCIYMEKKVFPTQAFENFATKNLVLARFEFPPPQRNFLEQRPPTTNDMIAQKYEVEGFPTLIMLDANGREVARGGPMDINELMKWLEAAVKAAQAK